MAGSIWDERKVLGKVRAYVKGRVAGGWRRGRWQGIDDEQRAVGDALHGENTSTYSIYRSSFY